MSKNTGAILENFIYDWVQKKIFDNDFLVSFPNVKIFKHKKYYSKERDAYIVADISVEKYFSTYDEEEGKPPALIIVLECKDYRNPLPVDDV